MEFGVERIGGRGLRVDSYDPARGSSSLLAGLTYPENITGTATAGPGQSQVKLARRRARWSQACQTAGTREGQTGGKAIVEESSVFVTYLGRFLHGEEK